MLNQAFIAVHSGEHCGPWASGLLYKYRNDEVILYGDVSLMKRFLCSYSTFRYMYYYNSIIVFFFLR